MADINLLAASSIILMSQRQYVEDDTAIDSSSGGVRLVNLGGGQGAKIISLIFHNTSSSTAYTLKVGVSLDNGSTLTYIYDDYSIAADTTWWAITPETTGPIFLEEYDEFRAHGSAGSEAYVQLICNYEKIT